MLIPMTVVLAPDDLLPFNEVVFHPRVERSESRDAERVSDPKDPELDNGEQDPEGGHCCISQPCLF